MLDLTVQVRKSVGDGARWTVAVLLTPVQPAAQVGYMDPELMWCNALCMHHAQWYPVICGVVCRCSALCRHLGLGWGCGAYLTRGNGGEVGISCRWFVAAQFPHHP